MIVSFSRKFVFVAVPKTGSQALRKRLRAGLSATDWEQATLTEQRLFPVAELAAIGHGHLTCRDIMPWLPPGMWEAFFTFGVVRHPFARFRSACGFYDPARFAASRDSNDEMKRLLDREGDHFLFAPQHHFLCGDDGRIAVNTVARYERLAEDMTVITRRIGLAEAPLERVNVTRTAPTQAFDVELRAMLTERYAQDFALFGYDAGSPA
ncbi:sulfotransferase family protein [Sphingomonas canadensis]|uniref:Sulfotransferase family protein n=1 Tax=Sphingomonas canadensis TaxID=1219257 RepID=A0ABW3H677_9SPHN|nr:sulfotransferase family protein [Sphingomonas canadensis]MCW3836915.1 sulfotransferase family protein [Sphingomonas canadensis]